MIAGTSDTLEYNFFYKDGSKVDLSSSTALLRICYLGQPSYAVAEIPGEISDENKVVFRLSSKYTKKLSGKFIQQPTLIDYSGQEYIYQQGIITIIPRIGSALDNEDDDGDTDIPDNGAIRGTIDAMVTNVYMVPYGFHNGLGTVTVTNSVKDALAEI